MILDVTGIQLIPGNKGADGPGNGEYIDSSGRIVECCCDECDYMMCCSEIHREEVCNICTDYACPRKTRSRNAFI